MFGLSSELITKDKLVKKVKRFKCKHFIRVNRLVDRWICSDKGLMLETSALKSLYGGQFSF